MTRWPAGSRAFLVDAAWGIAVTLVLALVISFGPGGRAGVDPVAYLWAAGLGGLMLVRRRFPVLVLVLSALGLFAYYALGFPAIGVAVPVAAAIYSAAASGRLVAALVTGAGVVAVSIAFRLAEGQDPAYVVGYELVSHVALIGAAVAWGDSVRSRRDLRERQEQVRELLETRHADEVRSRVQDERMAIARDLHDSLGNALAAVSLHTEVAREALERSDAAAAGDGIARARGTASRTLHELRSTVSVLRAGDPASPGPSLGDLDELAERVGATGLEVVFEGDPPSAIAAPRRVGSSAYRIVQEALTNVVRHAGARRVVVTLRRSPDALDVAVVDDGRGDGPIEGGSGIPGMSERAVALGGSLSARREADGFAVRARLPVGGES